MDTLQTSLNSAEHPRGVENANTALVPEALTVPQAGNGDAIAIASPVARLPVELEVTVPVRDFRVRNLLTLVPNVVIESRWGHADDVPLRSGDVQLAWSEFEVVDTQLAVRLTRLA